MRIGLVLLIACADPEIGDDSAVEIRAEDCIPTLGDNCSCSAQCMTQEQYDEITEWCDIECGIDVYDWECTVVDGACAVVE